MSPRLHRTAALPGAIRRAAGVPLAAGLLLVGCASNSPASSGADTVPPPGRSSVPATAGTTTAPAAAPVVVPYWIRDKVVAAGQARPLAPGTDGPRAALDALLGRPNKVEKDNGFTTELQTNVEIRGFGVADGIATVDLSRTFETYNTRPQVAQVVFTLTQFPEVKKVRFLIEGQPNGATGVPPMDRADVADKAPPILVEAPLPGTIASGGSLAVSGTVPVAVTAVTWRLEGGDGPPLATGTLTVAPIPRDKTYARATGTVTLPAPTTYSGPAWLTFDTGAAGAPAVRVPLLLA